MTFRSSTLFENRNNLIDPFLPDRSSFHEGEPALHEEDDDGHDEEEEVVDVRGDGVVLALEVGEALLALAQHDGAELKRKEKSDSFTLLKGFCVWQQKYPLRPHPYNLV